MKYLYRTEGALASLALDLAFGLSLYDWVDKNTLALHQAQQEILESMKVILTTYHGRRKIRWTKDLKGDIAAWCSMHIKLKRPDPMGDVCSPETCPACAIEEVLNTL